MTKKVITSKEGTAHTVYYEDTDDNTVVKFDVPAPTETDSNNQQTITSHSKTDSFGRKVFDELQLGTGFVSRQFGYHAGEVTAKHVASQKLKSSPTTQLVSQIVLSDGRTLTYEYDDEERIISVADSFEGTTTYTYDALGQLLTEKVTKGDETNVVNSMEYDNYGNITKKNGIVYVYGDSKWKDLLTSYNGQTITYDAQGNPLTYLDYTLTWEKGRQLKKLVKSDGTVIDYTYNANGIRTSKTVGGVTHTYTLEGTKILREVWDGNTLIPLYDNENSVCGIIYNNVPYYFLKNLQGDVIAIVDKDAQTVARYSYDAWGKIVFVVDAQGKEITSTSHIAHINPYRYRSYYYDTEIAKYYLQSRYYDPNVGRLVNTDDPTIINNSTDKESIGLNKFCYCLNSPSNDSDECGSVAGVVVKMISNFFCGMVGGMLGLYLANVTLNIANGKNDFYKKNDSWTTYISEGVTSGVLAICGSSLVYKITAVVGASVLKQMIDVFLGKNPFNLQELIDDIIHGTIFVCAIHFTSKVLRKLSIKQKKSSSKWVGKLKSSSKEITNHITKKMYKTIDKLITFFKNVFVKRFSISYAKKISRELSKIFR